MKMWVSGTSEYMGVCKLWKPKCTHPKKAVEWSYQKSFTVGYDQGKQASRVKRNKLTHQVRLLDHFIGIHGIGAALVVRSFLSIANTSNQGTFSTWKYNY